MLVVINIKFHQSVAVRLEVKKQIQQYFALDME